MKAIYSHTLPYVVGGALMGVGITNIYSANAIRGNLEQITDESAIVEREVLSQSELLQRVQGTVFSLTGAGLLAAKSLYLLYRKEES